MKTGKTLSELASEIERQANAKKDFIADTRKLQMVTSPDHGVVLTVPNGENHTMPLRQNAHNQIAARLDIPRKYYDKMRTTQPELLATNVNTWFQENPETRMVRTLDGDVRAFLSSSYKRIDNYDVAQTVLPVLSGIDGIRHLSAEITDSRMYIKCVTSGLHGTVESRRGGKAGEIVEGGVMIQNSEIGLGAISVKPYAFFQWCTNGCVRDKGMRAAHLGRKHDADADITELLSDSTKRMEDSATLMKVRDVVAAAFDTARFAEWIERVQESTERKIEGDPAKAIELLANDFNLLDNERGNVLRHFIEGADLSAFGLMNAVTRTAEDSESYDRATELETLGPSLIELPASQWSKIATAA